MVDLIWQWERGAVLGGIQVLCLDYWLQRNICNCCLHFLLLPSFLNPLNSGFYLHQSTRITHTKNISDFNVAKANGSSLYSWAHSTTFTYLEHPLLLASVMTCPPVLLLLSHLSSEHSPIYFTPCKTQIAPSYNSIYQILISPSFPSALHSHPNSLFFSVPHLSKWFHNQP